MLYDRAEAPPRPRARHRRPSSTAAQPAECKLQALNWRSDSMAAGILLTQQAVHRRQTSLVVTLPPFRADTTAEAATLLCPKRICTDALEVVRRQPPAPAHMLSHAAPHRFTTQTRHATLLPPSHRSSDAIATPARAAQLHRNGLDACYSSARERPAATIEAVL